MGNPAGGSIFGASRLKDLYPVPGAPPAPITPTPPPYIGGTQPSDSNNGLISNIVGDSTFSTNTGTIPNVGMGVTGGNMWQQGGGTQPTTGIVRGIVDKPVRATPSKERTVDELPTPKIQAPVPGLVTKVVQAPAPAAPIPAAPAKVAPNAKPGETLEQFRARIKRQRGL